MSILNALPAPGRSPIVSVPACMRRPHEKPPAGFSILLYVLLTDFEQLDLRHGKEIEVESVRDTGSPRIT